MGPNKQQPAILRLYSTETNQKVHFITYFNDFLLLIIWKKKKRSGFVYFGLFGAWQKSFICFFASSATLRKNDVNMTSAWRLGPGMSWSSAVYGRSAASYLTSPHTRGVLLTGLLPGQGHAQTQEQRAALGWIVAPFSYILLFNWRCEFYVAPRSLQTLTRFPSQVEV